jgi:hypothetical protein
LDAAHSRPDENPIQKPWRRTNSNRSVWLQGNELRIADYSETILQLGGVSYERMAFTQNWGAEFDLNIDGNIIQEQFWGAAISPSWASVAFTDIAERPIVTVYRPATSSVTQLRIIVYHAGNTIETLATTGTFTGLMNRAWYQFRLLVDRDRLVRVYINNVLRLQYWLPAQYAAGAGVRALNFLNQTSAQSYQRNFWLFDQRSQFQTLTAWTSFLSDAFGRPDGVPGNGWTQAGTAGQLVSGSYATTGTTDGSRAIVRDSGNTSGIQRIVGVIGGAIAPNTGADASLMLRINAAGTEGLAANIYSNKIYVARFTGSLTSPTMADYTSTDITGTVDLRVFPA